MSGLLQLGQQHQCLRDEFVVYQESARMGQICLSFGRAKAKKLSASEAKPADPLTRICPWTPLGAAKPPDLITALRSALTIIPKTNPLLDPALHPTTR